MRQEADPVATYTMPESLVEKIDNARREAAGGIESAALSSDPRPRRASMRSTIWRKARQAAWRRRSR